MISTSKAVLMGGLARVGTLENGTTYDSYELYVLQDINPENGFGSATVPMRFGKSENKAIFVGCKAGQHAELDILKETNGRGTSREVITAVRLINK